MKFTTLAMSTMVACVMSVGIASAQTTTTPMTKQPDAKSMPMDKSMDKSASSSRTMKKSKSMKMAKPAATRSAISMSCSADANAKGLHGKARKTFRKSCMKGLSMTKPKV